MAKFEPLAALKKLVENDEAPALARVQALKKIPHAPLRLLRRLLVRPVPIPPRLYAVAALAYHREIELRKQKNKWKPVARAQRRKMEADDEPLDTTGNSLGI